MSKGCLVINVDQLPPATSSPNARAHWAVKKRNADNYAEAVLIESLQLRNSIENASDEPFKPLRKVHLYLTFIFPVKRDRDPDNLIAMFKPGLDALVSAGILAGDTTDNVTFGRPKPVVDRTNAPKTSIVIHYEEGD